MFSSIPYLALSLLLAQNVITQPISTNTNTILPPVHPILRSEALKFENLAIRANGQILITTTVPNASIYQVDPLGILPITLIHEIANITSASGITEGAPDIFYVASGDISLKSSTTTTPESYTITEVDVRGVSVLPDGTLSRQPGIKHIASLPNAALPNGIAFAGHHANSTHLLVADTFRGLIWNVNTRTGAVNITLNDTTTQPGSSNAGVNGIKVHNGTIYYTNTGSNTLYKIPVNPDGTISPNTVPTVVTTKLSCDDFAVSHDGTAYVAGPLDIVTKVDLKGSKEVIAGSFNSTTSDLVGPTAIRFGRLVSDQWSLYVTTNGGLSGVGAVVAGSAGVSRVDLGYH